MSVTFSADGNILATRSWDKTIRLWDADTGQLRHTLTGHQDDVDIVVFSPDGRTLASGSQDNTVRLWDAITGEHVKTLRGHYSYLISLAFNPDGSILASGSEDDSIRLWNVSTGQYIGGLWDHEAGVETLAFSPDGTMLASGSRDDKIILWDLETREALHTITEHEDDVWAVAFSPDGTMLASGGGDTVSLWGIATEEVELLQTFRRPIDAEAVVGTPEELTDEVPTDLPANATSIVSVQMAACLSVAVTTERSVCGIPPLESSLKHLMDIPIPSQALLSVQTAARSRVEVSMALFSYGHSLT